MTALKIVPFDGFAMRNVDPDIYIIEWHHPDPNRLNKRRHKSFVQKGEVWIDHRFLAEKEFLLRIYKAETSPRLARLPYEKMRALLKREYTEKGPIPPGFKLRSKRRGSLTIWEVRGDLVRRYLDPHWAFGGHHYRYPDYTSENEIWIDALQDPREKPFTERHELDERAFMAKGMKYSEAHDLATDAELLERVRNFVLRVPKASKTAATRAPELPFVSQREGYCGPASLAIAAASLGVKDRSSRAWDQTRIGRFCGTTAKEGTDHGPLVAGARKIGLTVFEKAGGTIDELKDILGDPDFRVIVGYHSPSDPAQRAFDPERHKAEDHFAVVRRITPRFIEFMDPEQSRSKSGINRVRLDVFLKHRWWDTDGPGSAEQPLRNRVDRWYMAVNAKGKIIDLAGGLNHRP